MFACIDSAAQFALQWNLSFAFNKAGKRLFARRVRDATSGKLFHSEKKCAENMLLCAERAEENKKQDLPGAKLYCNICHLRAERGMLSRAEI